MLDVQRFYRTSDVLGSFSGIVINTLVLYIIKKTYSKKIAAYSRMMVVSAVYSILYGLIEFSTQHLLAMKDGVLFCVPKGLEKYVDHNLYWIFLLPHMGLSCLGLYILPSNYQYEYALLTDPDAVSSFTLLRNIGVATIAAAIPAAVSVASVSSARTRPEIHYIMMLSPQWLSEGNQTYISTMDIRDMSTKAYVVVASVISSAFCVTAVYYVWKIRSFLNQNRSLSEKTKQLQDQFTRVVLIQGANTFIFSFIPLSIVSLGTVAYNQVETLGLFVMIPMSWLPFTNGVYTLLAIRRYREYLLGLFGRSKVNTEKRIVSTVSGGYTDNNTEKEEEEAERSQ